MTAQFRIDDVVQHRNLGYGVVTAVDEVSGFVAIDIAGAALHTPPVNLTLVRRTVDPDALAQLDRNIRVWLDRDDIRTWINVATAAGLTVDP